MVVWIASKVIGTTLVGISPSDEIIIMQPDEKTQNQTVIAFSYKAKNLDEAKAIYDKLGTMRDIDDFRAEAIKKRKFGVKVKAVIIGVAILTVLGLVFTRGRWSPRVGAGVVSAAGSIGKFGSRIGKVTGAATSSFAPIAQQVKPIGDLFASVGAVAGGTLAIKYLADSLSRRDGDSNQQQ